MADKSTLRRQVAPGRDSRRHKETTIHCVYQEHAGEDDEKDSENESHIHNTQAEQESDMSSDESDWSEDEVEIHYSHLEEQINHINAANLTSYVDLLSDKPETTAPKDNPEATPTKNKLTTEEPELDLHRIQERMTQPTYSFPSVVKAWIQVDSQQLHRIPEQYDSKTTATGTFIQVSVLLDTGATGTFVRQEISQLLPQNGSTHLAVTTIDGTSKQSVPIVASSFLTNQNKMYPISAYALPELSSYKKPPGRLLNKLEKLLPAEISWTDLCLPTGGPIDLIVGTNHMKLQGHSQTCTKEIPGIEVCTSLLSNKPYLVGTYNPPQTTEDLHMALQIETNEDINHPNSETSEELTKVLEPDTQSG